MLGAYHETESLGGGRFRHIQLLRPIAYRRNGNLRRLTNTLGPSGDPSMPIGADELIQFRLRDRLAGQSPVLHFGRGQAMVQLTPLGTRNVAGVAIGANGFRYPKAWPNADLEFQMGGHIVHKAIRLRAGHPSRFQVQVDAYADFNPVTLSGRAFRILQPTLDRPDAESIGLRWNVGQSGEHYVLTVDLPPGDWSGWTLDPTLTLQPGAADGNDTRIIDTTLSANNYGINGTLTAGTGLGWIRRAMIRFDVSSIPRPATVNSATLTLYHESETSTDDYVVGAHRALTQWFEGAQNGAPPGAGEDGSTWDERNANGSVAWGAIGGQSGTDYTAVATANTTITAPLQTFDWNLLSDVAAFVAGTATNRGWWLIAADEVGASNKIFTSSDGATAANRPKLVIEYTMPSGGLIRRWPVIY